MATVLFTLGMSQQPIFLEFTQEIMLSVLLDLQVIAVMITLIQSNEIFVSDRNPNVP